MANTKLTLDDISDVRAYERERAQFRDHVIRMKKLRRISIGPVVTVVFENRDTIRFQIQEMARVEKMASDEQIQGELDVYNPLIPEPGELCATLFVELTDEASLREWLPKLVGVERAVILRLGVEPGSEVVRATPEQSHEELLTRAEVTSSVHYLRFTLDESQVERFGEGPVALAVDHPAYRHTCELGDDVRQELLGDLRP